ncbi:alpha/beta fold hydrolase [Mycobacterium sp. LTG2003]
MSVGRVVAIDVTGHGETEDMPCAADDFINGTELVLRTLDCLGIGKAIFAGHSMGGRMAIQLAAVAPDRVLAAILFNPAAGSAFDAAISSVLHSPRQMLRAMVGAAYDMYRDPFLMKVGAIARYLRMATAVTMGNALAPTGFTGAARSLLRSGACTTLLHTLRDRAIPTIVLHGEDDAIVPFENACDIAEDANATLYRVRGACHYWLIAKPAHGADAVRQLLDGALGEALRDLAPTFGVEDWRDARAWDEALFKPDARERELSDRRTVLRYVEREPVEMNLVRRAVVEVAAPAPRALGHARPA